MRSSKCAFSTAAALHHIFIAPIECSRALPRRHQLPAIQALMSSHASTSTRHLSSSSSSLPTTKRRLPRDDEIRDPMVRLVLEDNTLSAPQSTSRLLNSIDRQTESLVVVALPNADPDANASGFDSADGGDSRAYPICKIQFKKALREAEKSRSKKRDLPSATVKTIELNWAIDRNDLQHRLQRVRDFLAKGWRVDVVMAGKKKGRKASGEEMRGLVEGIRRAMREVEGAREWRDTEGTLGGMVTMFLEGKAEGKTVGKEDAP